MNDDKVSPSCAPSHRFAYFYALPKKQACYTPLMPRVRQLTLFSLTAAMKRRRARRRQRVGGALVVVDAKDSFLPHVAREAHHPDHPVHVTMRRRTVGPSFRSQRVCGAIIRVIANSRRNGVRVIEYSIQDNHLHLMVEGRDNADLANQMRTLFSRIAFAVNAVARRSGKLFRDRHHRHELTRPSEVRNALVYILFNDRKHRAQTQTSAPGPGTPTLDPCSSAWWFHAWAPSDQPPKDLLRKRDEAPTCEPETWLARVGWQRGGRAKDGRLRFSEAPRAGK
jgi:putative transposase